MTREQVDKLAADAMKLSARAATVQEHKQAAFDHARIARHYDAFGEAGFRRTHNRKSADHCDKVRELTGNTI